jgi:creatinine amidohydrolase
MNTDYLQAQWLAAVLVQRAAVVVWPTVGYGHYPAFVDYPGSCSLSPGTFRAMITELLEDFRRAGAIRSVILNTGISTIRPLEQVIACVQGFSELRLINFYEGKHYRTAAAELEQQPRGSHADESETSIMLAIAPDKVDMSMAERWVDREIKGRFSRTEPQDANFSPNGVYGDPTLASVEKGQRLLNAMLEDVLAVFPVQSA